MKIYRLAKKTAYIPENYDNIEKGEAIGTKWRLCAGGGDWEDAWSLMAFEIGDPAKKRVWAEITYDHIKGFKNDGEDDKNSAAEAKAWGKHVVETWLKITKKIFDASSEETYESSWEESCWEALNDKAMKGMVKDKEKGIDSLEWVSKEPKRDR